MRTLQGATQHFSYSLKLLGADLEPIFVSVQLWHGPNIFIRDLLSSNRAYYFREIYKNNHKTFVIFTINFLNFFLSTLTKHTLFSPNYPSLQTKSKFLSFLSSKQRQLSTLESSTNGDGKRQR